MSIKRSIAVATIACFTVTGLGAASASAATTPKRHPGTHVVSVRHNTPKRTELRRVHRARLSEVRRAGLEGLSRSDKKRHLQQLRHVHRSHTVNRHR
jgi:hypothetical protein